MKAAVRLAGCLVLTWVVSTPAAEMPDLERGRALYENHCRVCHTDTVHTRPRRSTFSAEALRDVVDKWQREENLRWGPQEIADVVFYLGATRYKFQSP